MRLWPKLPINNYRGEEFYGAVTAESQQRWAVSHPCCCKGYHSLRTHPGNRDCLNPANAVQGSGCRDWEYGIHRGALWHHCRISESAVLRMTEPISGIFRVSHLWRCFPKAISHMETSPYARGQKTRNIAITSHTKLPNPLSVRRSVVARMPAGRIEPFLRV